MSIKTYKPTTPSRRHMTVSGFDGIDKKAKPERSLTETLKKSAGRNSYGRIDRKSTRLNSSHSQQDRMPSSA